ncbi:hypothetical protein CC80DRAFT_490652 [Byssothecium circinans]|uniref:Uncharacterized protein n=1 Tax=Byssothecium circinans TaxID=147558 RepID=A0A6A5U2H5_9PLEO|nr:hypothetical protein CC80DRAFT_490652 [Byssothecium circinans]
MRSSHRATSIGRHHRSGISQSYRLPSSFLLLVACIYHRFLRLFHPISDWVCKCAYAQAGILNPFDHMIAHAFFWHPEPRYYTASYIIAKTITNTSSGYDLPCDSIADILRCNPHPRISPGFQHESPKDCHQTPQRKF